MDAGLLLLAGVALRVPLKPAASSFLKKNDGHKF